MRLPLPPPGQGRIWRGLVSQEGVVLAALIQGPLTWEGNPIASSCLCLREGGPPVRGVTSPGVSVGTP